MNFHPPRPTPHSKKLNAVEFVWTMARNPLEIWAEGAYAAPFVRSEWMGVPTFLLNDPAIIRHVMVDNSKNYAMQPLRQRLLRPILRDGLLTAEGELWKRTRRSIAPVFAPRNVQGLAGPMRERCALFAGGLADVGTVDIAEQMTLLTFDILQTTLFTGDIAGEPREFAAATAELLHTMGRIDPLDVLDAPAFLPRITHILGRKSLAFFRQLIAATIAKRRKLMEARPGDAPRDLLTLLLEADGLSPNEVEDNIITFIGAGHETTARALAWTLYLLSQADDERTKVEAELDAHDWDGDPASWADTLPQTRAVFEESMRLYPPAASLNRMAIAEDKFGDLTIPAGSTILVMPWIIHRHKKLWDSPDAFMPSRFLPENRANIDRYQFLPFGIGPRVCIGSSFAMQEAIIALASLLRRQRYSYAGDRPPQPVMKITVQPERELMMRVSAR